MWRRLLLREGQVKAVRKRVHRNGLKHSSYEGCEPFFRSISLYGVEVAYGMKLFTCFYVIQKSLANPGTRLREVREMSGHAIIS